MFWVHVTCCHWCHHLPVLEGAMLHWQYAVEVTFICTISQYMHTVRRRKSV